MRIQADSASHSASPSSPSMIALPRLSRSRSVASQSVARTRSAICGGSARWVVAVALMHTLRTGRWRKKDAFRTSGCESDDIHSRGNRRSKHSGSCATLAPSIGMSAIRTGQRNPLRATHFDLNVRVGGDPGGTTCHDFCNSHLEKTTLLWQHLCKAEPRKPRHTASSSVEAAAGTSPLMRCLDSCLRHAAWPPARRLLSRLSRYW